MQAAPAITPTTTNNNNNIQITNINNVERTALLVAQHITSISNNTRCIFIALTGASGTGKHYLINKLKSIFNNNNSNNSNNNNHAYQVLPINIDMVFTNNNTSNNEQGNEEEEKDGSSGQQEQQQSNSKYQLLYNTLCFAIQQSKIHGNNLHLFLQSLYSEQVESNSDSSIDNNNDSSSNSTTSSIVILYGNTSTISSLLFRPMKQSQQLKQSKITSSSPFPLFYSTMDIIINIKNNTSNSSNSNTGSGLPYELVTRYLKLHNTTSTTSSSSSNDSINMSNVFDITSTSTSILIDLLQVQLITYIIQQLQTPKPQQQQGNQPLLVINLYNTIPSPLSAFTNSVNKPYYQVMIKIQVVVNKNKYMNKNKSSSTVNHYGITRLVYNKYLDTITKSNNSSYSTRSSTYQDVYLTSSNNNKQNKKKQSSEVQQELQAFKLRDYIRIRNVKGRVKGQAKHNSNTGFELTFGDSKLEPFTPLYHHHQKQDKQHSQQLLLVTPYKYRYTIDERTMGGLLAMGYTINTILHRHTIHHRIITSNSNLMFINLVSIDEMNNGNFIVVKGQDRRLVEEHIKTLVQYCNELQDYEIQTIVTHKTVIELYSEARYAVQSKAQAYREQKEEELKRKQQQLQDDTIDANNKAEVMHHQSKL